jgi:hypothetical protein
MQGFGWHGNLLVNGGFEAELAPAWERRTPEDASRKIYRASGEGRTGAAVNRLWSLNLGTPAARSTSCMLRRTAQSGSRGTD